MKLRARGTATVWYRSVHLKLALIMILLVCSVLVAVGEYLLVRVSAYYEESFRAAMYNVFTADTVSTLQESAAGGADALWDTVSAYSGRLGVGSGTDRDVYILDGSSGEYLAGGRFAGSESVPFTKNILTALNGKVGSGNGITEDCFDVAVPVEAEGGGYIVYVRDDKQQTDDLNRILIGIVVQAVIFGLLVAVLLSVILAKTLTRPIEELTRGARRVSRGEFAAVQVRAGDEIGVLGESFNDMSRTLEHSVQVLNDERDKYSSLLLHMSDGVLSFDGSGACMHINPAARDMLGLGEGEMPEYATLFTAEEAALARVLARPAGEYTTLTLQREENILQVILSLAGSAGQEQSVIAVVHNVTREQRLEQARRKFIADVSHELRTPLTNIKGYAETISNDDDMPAPLRRRFLLVVQNEADRMLRIVKDLLTLSKMDNRSMNWHFEWVDMENLLENINTAMQMRAAEKKHSLTMVLQGTLPMVWSDKERIEQVIVNLLSNGVNYTPEGGSIRLIASREGDRVRICVHDNGIGIPESDLPHLFDRFYRVDKARSRESGGTGLGLAITAEIVAKHKGEIAVESEVGSGTTFTVTLPIDSGVGRGKEE